MQRLIRNGVRLAIFGCAGWMIGAAARADEELPPPVAESVEAAEAELELADDPEARPDRAAGANEGVPGLFEASPEVLEFTRKLNQQLRAAETRKTSKLHVGLSGGLRPGICTGNCPICGTPVKAAEDFTLGVASGARGRRRAANWLFQDVDVEHLQGDHSPEGQEKLLPGEPAQVILELRERLGAGAPEGSEFTVKPDALAKLIRALDREANQQEAPLQPEPTSWAPAAPSWSDVPNPTSPDDEAAISALRAASRQLDEAADLLEQQNLFERADELRELADQLRNDARAFLQERTVPQPSSTSRQQTSGRPSCGWIAVKIPALGMDFATADLCKIGNGTDGTGELSKRNFNFFMGFAR